MQSTTDKLFMDYADEFLELVLRERRQPNIHLLREVTTRSPFPIPPVLIKDYRALTVQEKVDISKCYQSLGVTHFVACNALEHSDESHPLHIIAAQLSESLQLQHPLRHPLEGHPEAVKRFGPDDATVKIYDLPKQVGGSGYREVAETSDSFEVHLDGLGSGGTVDSVFLYMDQAPLFGGFTFFYDLLALGIALSCDDMEAFRHLFLPDAFTAVRPRGKGAIKVVTPVFYIDEAGLPHVFFRKDSGEYRMSWREGCAPLERARKFLEQYTKPFANGSYFVPFTRKGCACISRNRDIAHGRIGFIDGEEPCQRRLLSRKWFMTSAKHAIYKHVPGIAVRSDVASLSADRFGEPQLEGEWLYNAAEDRNIRLK